MTSRGIFSRSVFVLPSSGSSSSSSPSSSRCTVTARDIRVACVTAGILILLHTISLNYQYHERQTQPLTQTPRHQHHRQEQQQRQQHDYQQERESQPQRQADRHEHMKHSRDDKQEARVRARVEEGVESSSSTSTTTSTSISLPTINPSNAGLPFMVSRVTRLANVFHHEAKRLHSMLLSRNRSPQLFPLVKRKIAMILGLIPVYGMDGLNGSPQGDLIQWADLWHALTLLGHDVTIAQSYSDFQQVANNIKADPKHYDLIFGDYIGFNWFRNQIDMTSTIIRTRLLLIDLFGTSAKFNEMSPLAGRLPYCCLNVPRLSQILVISPPEHNDDTSKYNRFLGYVIMPPELDVQHDVEYAREMGIDPIDERKNCIVIYAKQAEFFRGHEKLMNLIGEIAVDGVYATVPIDTWNIKHLGISPPANVTNLGYLKPPRIWSLLRRCKIYLGLGKPYDGVAAVESLAAGNVLVLPRFNPPHTPQNDPALQGKPFERSYETQSPFAQSVGKPWVYVIDESDMSSTRAVLMEILSRDSQQFQPHMPDEYTPRTFLERVHQAVQDEASNAHNTQVT